MGRSFRGGKSLYRQSRSATGLPSLASSTTLRGMASASSSSKAWVASVALFKAPLGRPRALPDSPGSHVLLPVFFLFFQEG